MKSIEDIERLIKKFCAGKQAQVRTTPELDEKIIADALPVQNKSKTERLAVLRPKVWGIIMRSRITKYTTAAVIILAIIIGIVEFGKPIGASAAFAAAMDNIEKAQTFSCIRISEMQYESGPEHGTYVLKQKRMFKEPDRERLEQLTSAPPWPKDVGMVTIWHYGKRQRLRYRPFDKTAEFRDLSSDYTIDEKTGELKLTQLSTRLRDYLLELSSGAVEDLGRVKLNGKSVRMLRSRKGNRVYTVWVNPKTNYPVQIENAWADQKLPPVMFTSIQIDAELGDAMFSLEPPDGYTLSVSPLGWPDDKMKMMAKIRHLGLWCIMYAGDNDNQFPAELADLVTWGVAPREVLNRLLAAPGDPTGHSVIRYRKPDTTGTNLQKEIILYEIYDQWPDEGVVACFADGHCELISDQNRFEELVK